ncbi:inactive N-acetylated-alpha-linked acidic dipeptidase-like protein 2 isoform X1 [Ictalurus punctatus]|uniref:Inactive N-acetylated-alpha-linked acidic dipeptidase-like protein 2 isoform X1 n=1 Tax=Ictalurus punctatus TaxID=7998 RepID=A0A2D0RTZ9_ICTPU|nr:inactive N-acetylated-alpha-linked acidic dipeptidase-like protein 2 isoform X1 [Ictalurus punctatus]XP_017333970.1 inactive N-acetylated-alpha-linked acidic dipeptidase-like protein 2 isoform X1 [Ictalurus punctatus]XP_017333971.1 inactive N-acetylated-alpha-linked acidic dipeptidase-like protein 2 isoform X1 [Ictalurus punctatus]XP_053539121.1 inactive N-acetylated-alpha-linked acidic dipeptidase-like protein 2 isoform X1 [Ictalurus punctatus]
MAYTKAHASHGSSMHLQVLECEDQLATLDLEWEMEKELEEPGMDNLQLEYADSQTLGNSSTSEINPDQEFIQPSVSPHGRFERLQEDPNYLQYSGTVPKAHKMSATCIVKYLMLGTGAFFLGLLIGLHAKRTEEQPTTPTASTDMLEKVMQDITAEKIQAIKREFDSLSGLGEEAWVKYLAQRWEEFGLKNIQLINYTVLISSPGSFPNTITDIANKQCFLPSGASCDTKAHLSINESFAFAAYSSVGSLEGELVDVQYGSSEDLRLIQSEKNVTNKIALLKIGPVPLLNTLSLLAEMGFAACLIYVDPCDIPEDQPLMQKAFGVTLNPGGDPSTPEYPSTDGSFREDCRNLTSLLVQPISVKLAKELLSAQSIRYSQPCVPMEMASSSGQRIINLSIGSQTSYRRVYNVIGYLRGKINPDRYILVGTRHSSWYEGALADWSGGAAVVSQIIASLTAQTRAHWQPDRSIVFCSLGGSALGNIGSFEWGEANKVVLENRVVAYVSLHSPVRAYGPQSTASPSLLQLASDIHKRHVKSCLHVGGCTGLNISSLQSPVVMDFFTSQLAAPLVEFASSANPAESAHFLSEAFFPLESSLTETLDPAFRLHETVAKMSAEAILRLATDPVLPFSPLDIALDIQNKLKADPLIRHDLLDAAASLRESSGFFQSEIMRPANDPKERDPSHVRMLNDVLQDLEKSFLISDPPRGFSRNILYGLNNKTQGFAILKASAEDSKHSSVNWSLSQVFNSICSAEKLVQSGLELFENNPDSSH